MLTQLQSRQLFCAYEPWVLWFECKTPPIGLHLDTYFLAGGIVWEPWACFWRWNFPFLHGSGSLDSH